MKNIFLKFPLEKIGFQIVRNLDILMLVLILLETIQPILFYSYFIIFNLFFIMMFYREH